MYEFIRVVEETKEQELSGYWVCTVELTNNGVQEFSILKFENEPTFDEVAATAIQQVEARNAYEAYLASLENPEPEPDPQPEPEQPTGEE